MTLKANVARWTTPLAKAAGISTGRMYQIFPEDGYRAPYTSELKGLTVLRARGFACNGYTPMEDAVGAPLPPLIAKTKPKRAMTPNRTNGAHGTTPELSKIDDKKKHGKWTDRLLLTRLARLMPGGPTKKNKNRVRWLLKKHGHKDVRKMHEAEALGVMKAEGISIEGFQHSGESSPGEKPPQLIPLPELRDRYQKATQQLELLTAALVERDKKIAEQQKILSDVRHGLKQYETQILPIALARFGGLVEPLNYPIDVLNRVRTLH